MKILFITSTHLGDAILSTGILDHFIHQYPACEITIACGPIPAPLFDKMPCLKKIIPLRKKRAGGHWVYLWWQCWRNHWDIIVDLRGTAISYFLWAKKRYIWKSQRAAMLKSNQLAQLIGLSEVPFNKIWITDAHIQRAHQLLPEGRTYVAFSPAANWDKKMWPLSYFVELAALLGKNKNLFPSIKFVIFGAPSQRSELQPLFEGLKAEQIIDLIGKISLLEVAACLKQCKVFIGNDSGLMHLAATLGIPTVGLFGPSDPRVYGPWGPFTSIVKTPLSFEDNMHQVRAGESVMQLIKPHEVVKSVEKFFTQCTE